MTNFHWGDFGLPAILLILVLSIALATWLLHMLFPLPQADLPREEDAAQPTRPTLSDDA